MAVRHRGREFMRVNTIITLGASIGFGLVGVFLARGLINSAIEKEFSYTQTTQEHQPKAAVAINTVPVLIADDDFQFGDVTLIFQS